MSDATSHESPPPSSDLPGFSEEVPWGGSQFDSGEHRGGLSMQFFLYGHVAVFFWCAGTAYWFLTYEVAGTVMLLLTGMVAGTIAGYFGFPRRGERRTVAGMAPHPRSRARSVPHPTGAGDVPSARFEVKAAEEAEAWFPRRSLWPFVIGVGALLFANGLLLGIWLWLPALAFLIFALLGFALQSRRRD